MSGQFLLGVIIALLLLANWVTLYNRSDQAYQFKDGEMRIVSSNSQISLSKMSMAHALESTPTDTGRVTAAQFGVLEGHFNAAAGLCPSQRVKNIEPSIGLQHDLLIDSVTANDFRLSLENALRFNTATKSALDVGCATAFHSSIIRDAPALSWRCVSPDKKLVTRARAEFFSQRFKPAEAYACMESIFDLPFQKKSFDSIFYFGLKQSMDQQHARLLLCDAARVVKPDGVVVLIIAPSSADAASVIGPAWTRGGIEKPAGERDMGGWVSAFYTIEQQQRLHVDEYGTPRVNSTGQQPFRVSRESFLNSAWLQTAASTCGFEVLSLPPGKSPTGIYLKRRPSPKKKSPVPLEQPPKVAGNAAKEFVQKMKRFF